MFTRGVAVRTFPAKKQCNIVFGPLPPVIVVNRIESHLMSASALVARQATNDLVIDNRDSQYLTLPVAL